MNRTFFYLITLSSLVTLALCNCPTLEAPKNGQVVGYCNSFSESRCWIKCNNNNTLYTRVCTRYGFWSGNQLDCSASYSGSEFDQRNAIGIGPDFNVHVVKLLVTAIRNAARDYNHPRMAISSANVTKVLGLFANSPAFLASLSMDPIQSFVRAKNGLPRSRLASDHRTI